MVNLLDVIELIQNVEDFLHFFSLCGRQSHRYFRPVGDLGQHRQQLAEEAAKQEAEERQQSLLAARLEQQRLAAEADAATPAPSRDELKAELQQELESNAGAPMHG